MRASHRIISFFGRDRILNGLTPGDFDQFRESLLNGLKGKRSPVSWGKSIRLSRMVFKYADDTGMVERQLLIGNSLKEPSKRVMRLDRQSRDKRMSTYREIKQFLRNGSMHVRQFDLALLRSGCRSDVRNLAGRVVSVPRQLLDG